MRARPRLNERDAAFLHASRAAAAAEQRQRRRRTNILRMLTVVACIAALVATLFGVQMQRSAERADNQAATAEAETGRANLQRDIALARQLIVQINQMSSAEADRTLLFSATASRLADDKDAHNTLLHTLIVNERLARVERTNYAVRSVAFSGDSKWLAVGSLDGALRLFPGGSEAWIARACSIVGRNVTQAEWNQYVSPERPYERTCMQFPPGEGAPLDAP